jgi:hypothetical protein
LVYSERKVELAVVDKQKGTCRRRRKPPQDSTVLERCPTAPDAVTDYFKCSELRQLQPCRKTVRAKSGQPAATKWQRGPGGVRVQERQEQKPWALGSGE